MVIIAKALCLLYFVVFLILQSGLSALMMASQEGKAKVVGTLLKADAKMDLKDQV